MELPQSKNILCFERLMPKNEQDHNSFDYKITKSFNQKKVIVEINLAIFLDSPCETLPCRSNYKWH